MRILVTQIARMGDVIQTTPLVRALKRRYPDAHIAAMVRRMGKAIAERNSDIDEVMLYDEDAVFRDLRAEDSDRFLRAYDEAEGYVRRIEEGGFDVAYNCTHSLASAMLLKLAGIPKVFGAHLSDDWRFVLRGRAVNYFFTSVFHRGFSDLNLCDLFRLFLDGADPAQGLVFDLRDEDREFVRALLDEHGVCDGRLVVCMQLGASDTDKRWPEAHFAALARRLVEQRQARIFLVGVREEAPLGEAFEREAPGIAAPLYGKTSIPQLAALLERAGVLVTNDTGTMHLAAAVGCPVVLISVGYVHFRETGPFGDGHCAIERRRETPGRSDLLRTAPDERAVIQPDHVLRGIEMALGDRSPGDVVQMNESNDWAGVDLYTARVAPDGCLQWYPVIRRPITRADYMRVAYRAMWLEFLGAGGSERAEAESLGRMLRCYERVPDDAIAAWRAELGGAFETLAELARGGAQTTLALLDLLERRDRVESAKELVRELTALDEEMRLFGEIDDVCKPLVATARFERDNLEGSDPLVLAQTTLQIYRDLEARARLTREKLERVADAMGGSHG